MNHIFLNCGASLLCFRCTGFVLLDIHAKTSACGACENQSFKVLLFLGLKGFRIHEPNFFELWGLPALFSLRGLRPFRNPCKDKLLLLLGLPVRIKVQGRVAFFEKVEPSSPTSHGSQDSRLLLGTSF